MELTISFSGQVYRPEDHADSGNGIIRCSTSTYPAATSKYKHFVTDHLLQMASTISFGEANSGFQAGIINGPVNTQIHHHAPLSEFLACMEDSLIAS